MKALLTITIATLALTSHAQSNIPNQSFENWTNQGTYETPDSWFGTNDVIGSFGVVCVNKSADAAHGSFSLELESKQVVPGTVAPGAVTTGEVAFDAQFNPTFFGGSPFDRRPSLFGGMYKFAPNGADTGTAIFTLTVRDTVADTNTVVGIGAIDFDTAQPAWTPFQVPMVFFTADVPDTLLIVFVSSRLGGGSPAGTTLMIDDVYHPDTLSGIGDPVSFVPISIGPNPASEQLHVSIASGYAGLLCIHDITGALVEIINVAAGDSQVSLAGYDDGLYLYWLGSSDGRMITSGKFVVHR